MGNNNHPDHVNDVMNRDISDSAPIATLNDLKTKTMVNDQTAYIIADAFIGNPYQLLGQVIEVRKTDGQCPTNLVNAKDLNFEFSSFPVTGLKVDEQSKLAKPQLRGSIIVNKALCAQAGFLNFLSAQLDQKSTFSLVIMDQASGLVNFQDPSWTNAITQWKQNNQDKMNDPEICYIYVVSGFIQKNIIKKKYYLFEAGAKGGAYGLNIDGKLSTSTDEYSLDVVFGLTPAIIKRPPAASANVLKAAPAPSPSTEHTFTPSVDEARLFNLTSGLVLDVP
ncbi:hypothetical protein [Chitinophaga vietnamensis]|uniref:hypothetical protein n=1 Tax=Chitinophaga vietnamensis TaxID=2593957 RepID=UPI00117824B6|nr:hypothetical protein [Chitinophaga vietnamensis]